MLIGSVIKNPPVPLLLNNTDVDRVSTFKLLCSHREKLTRRFFVRHGVQNETCCLNYLLPPKREITAKLRNTKIQSDI